MPFNESHCSQIGLVTGNFAVFNIEQLRMENTIESSGVKKSLKQFSCPIMIFTAKQVHQFKVLRSVKIDSRQKVTTYVYCLKTMICSEDLFVNLQVFYG